MNAVDVILSYVGSVDGDTIVDAAVMDACEFLTDAGGEVSDGARTLLTLGAACALNQFVLGLGAEIEAQS